MSAITNILKENAANYGILLTEGQLLQFDRYAQLLLEWGARMNLTAIKDEEGIALKHFLDSILLVHKVAIPEGTKMIDVGCGAGFPGIPAKIVRPDLELTLCDGTGKKVTFLREVVKDIHITAQPLHARAEELGRTPEHREQYGAATARAVAHLRELSEYCLPFVKVGGIFAAMKSGNIDTELCEAQKAVRELGGSIEEVVRFSLPGDNERSVVMIKKISQTAPKYPRPYAKMTKSPL